MNRNAWLDILIKALLAFAFFYVLKSVILNASVGQSLAWATAMSLAAAALAYSHYRR